MRTTDSTFATLLDGDQLDLVALIQIERSETPLRYALDAVERTWDGETFAPTGGGFGEIQELAERQVPTLQMVLQNVDGVLGPLVHPGVDGGEDVRGRRVTIRQASRSLLTGGTPTERVIEWVFFVNAYSWIGRAAVAFDLGVFPAEALRVPDRTMQGLRCRWMYRGAHCGYTGTLPKCEQTRADCRNHFPDEPLRFGGFPTAADARALRVN